MIALQITGISPLHGLSAPGYLALRLRDQDNIALQQLERGAFRESSPARLGLIIHILQFLKVKGRTLMSAGATLAIEVG